MSGLSMVSQVRQYRKRPVVIEALKWNGDNIGDIEAFVGLYNFKYTPTAGLDIHTKEGTMHANVGDFIIRGVKSEYYPCKPDIFDATYEAVDA